ncbi:hypothetical protein ABIC28_005153 [Rhodococcus sp. PvR044]|uniref:hypothetical protein n=1 Tax=Rhodococcus sp. PvR044 TaxID=3156402 RepID=UPI003396A784
MPAYPADYLDFATEQFGRIHQGHSLNPEVLAVDLRAARGEAPTKELLVEELHMQYHPRLKWCGQLFGFPCDEEGDWHSHWAPTQPGDGTAFTTAQWTEPEENR